MTGAAHVSMLIIGRMLVGYAVGTITGVAPVFGAEIAKVSTVFYGESGETFAHKLFTRPMRGQE